MKKKILQLPPLPIEWQAIVDKNVADAMEGYSRSDTNPTPEQIAKYGEGMRRYFTGVARALSTCNPRQSKYRKST